MSSDPRLDALLAEAAEAAPEPRAAGKAATLAALGRGRPRRLPPLAALAAAALLLLGLGVGLGFLWGRDGGRETTPTRSTDWAARERRVFEEARTALGEDLAWLASAGGEITVALSPEAPRVELRVVELELRDDQGRTVARPRVVLPDGRVAEIRLGEVPRLRLRATALGGDAIEVDCRLGFDDGATWIAPPQTLAAGEIRKLGEVTTGGRTLALFAVAD